MEGWFYSLKKHFLSVIWHRMCLELSLMYSNKKKTNGERSCELVPHSPLVHEEVSTNARFFSLSIYGSFVCWHFHIVNSVSRLPTRHLKESPYHLPSAQKPNLQKHAVNLVDFSYTFLRKCRCTGFPIYWRCELCVFIEFHLVNDCNRCLRSHDSWTILQWAEIFIIAFSVITVIGSFPFLTPQMADNDSRKDKLVNSAF